MDRKQERSYAMDFCEMASALFEYYKKVYPNSKEFHIDLFAKDGYNRVSIRNDYLGDDKDQPLSYELDGLTKKELHDISEPRHEWAKCKNCGTVFREDDSKALKVIAFRQQDIELACPRCCSTDLDWESPSVEVKSGN